MCCALSLWTSQVKLVLLPRSCTDVLCLACRHEYKSQGPILVVMHSDSLQFWQGELGFWADPGLNVISYAGKLLDWRSCLQVHWQLQSLCPQSAAAGKAAEHTVWRCRGLAC